MDRIVLGNKSCSRESNNLTQNNRRPFVDKTNRIMEESKLEVKTRFGRIATRFSPKPNKLRSKNTSFTNTDSSENEKLIETKKRKLQVSGQKIPEKVNVRKQGNVKAIGKENTDFKNATNTSHSSENEDFFESKKLKLQKETIGLGRQKISEKKNVQEQGNFNVKAIGKENTDSKNATVSKPVTNAVTEELKQNKLGIFKRSPVKGLSEDEVRRILEIDDQPVSPRKRQLDNCSSHTNVLKSKTENLKETQTSKSEEKRSENKHFLRNRKIPNYALLESSYLNNPELDPKFKNCYVAVEQITKSLLTSKCSNADNIWQKVHVPIWRKHVPIIPDIDMKDQLRPSQKLTLYEFDCDSPEETGTAPKRKKKVKQKMKQIKRKRTVKKVQGFKYVIGSNDRLGNTGKRWQPIQVPTSSVDNQPSNNAKNFTRPIPIATTSTDDQLGNNVVKTRRPIQISSSVNNRSGDNARKLRQLVQNTSSTDDRLDNSAVKMKQPVQISSSTDYRSGDSAANCFAKPVSVSNSYIPLNEPFEMESRSYSPEMDYDDRASSRCSSVTSFLNHVDGLGKKPLQTGSPWRSSLPLRPSLGFEVKSSNLLPSYNQDVSKSLFTSSSESFGTAAIDTSTSVCSNTVTIDEPNSQSVAQNIDLYNQQSTPKKRLQQPSLLKHVTLSRRSIKKDNLSKVSENRLSSHKSPRTPFRNITQNMCSTPNSVGVVNSDHNLRNNFSINRNENTSRVRNANTLNFQNKQNIPSDNISEKENVTYSDDSDFFVEKNNSNLYKNTENVQNKQNIQSDNISEKEYVNDSDESDFFVEEDNGNLNKNTENCKPTRISYSDIRKLKEGVENNEDDFENEYIASENVTLPSPVPDTVETNDDRNVGLFEDIGLKVKKVNRTYNATRLESNRTHKAVRFDTSVSSDEDCSEEKKPKKKRKKNTRSRKEIMEAAKWTREFNSMCKEVDEFELVIE